MLVLLSFAMDFTSSSNSFAEGKFVLSLFQQPLLFIMYLTEVQVNRILDSPYYSDRVTYNFICYELYRSRRKAEVTTLRFNLTASVSPQFVKFTIMEELQSRYQIATSLLGSVQYDLLLLDHSKESYYIFRANSNQTYYNEESEIRFSLNYHNVHQLCEDALQINLADLNVAFESSKVSIARALAIVFTFVK
jgi:hypothetical protein